MERRRDGGIILPVNVRGDLFCSFVYLLVLFFSLVIWNLTEKNGVFWWYLEGGLRNEWVCWACFDQSYTDQFFFFFGKIRGFLFSVYWAFFFLVGLPVTLLLLLLFSDFSSKFFLDFFFLIYFLFESVSNFD